MAKRIFKRPVDDRHDKLAFTLAFLFGFAGILAFRVVGDFFGEPQTVLSLFDFMAVFTSIGIIVLYTIYIVATPDRAGISLDRAGDNAYYLGLLFTLISLGYSLIKIVAIVTGGKEPDDASSVTSADRVIRLLPDFGLALASTIAGIFCRVFVQQFRNDPADIETQARQELGQAVRDLRASLLRAVADMNSVSRSTNVATIEMVTHINKTLEDAAATNVATIGQVGQEIKKLTDEVTNQVDKISGFSESVMQELSATSQTTNKATGEMVTHINRTLEGAATSNAATIGQVGKNFEKLAETTAKQVREISVLWEGTIGEIGEVVESVREQVLRLNIDPTDLQKRLVKLSAEFEALQVQISKTNEVQSDFAKGLTEATANLTSSFSPDVASSVKNAADDMLTRQAQVNTDLDKLVTGIRETNENFIDLGSELAKTKQTFRETLNTTVSASSQYVDSLTDATTMLRRAIEDKE